ncbi:MAG: DUF4178 domain-containing protein [Acidobacteria bacterium]|nr:DUF4178 domain-containing protein [Acidobacteriota bacterium]
MSSAPKPNVKSLSCPNCGGSVQVRGMGRAATVVCIQCLSVLDATSPSLTVLQTFKAAERYQPLIPLGTRGKMRGDPYEVIGFQVRELMADGVPYSWSEYLLFNPFKGFRYLSEYNGHWNDITTIKSVPMNTQEGGRAAKQHLATKYVHFQHYDATTIYVMGEFPWQVRVGEKAVCDDYIAPPYILSSEASDNEVNWSIGEYTAPETIWKNFGLKTTPPSPVGVFANQPSQQKGEVAKSWGRWLFWTTALFVLQLFWSVFDSNRKVFQETYTFVQNKAGTQAEHSFVTPVFELPGRTSSVKVDLATDLNNNGAFFNLALINTENGKAFDFSRQVGYYSGRDSDGSWTEGKQKDSVVLPSIEPGKYYLRVEPEGDPSETNASVPVKYQITVKRDVPTWGYFWIGAILLLIPPIWTSIRSGSFESKRWAESDYGGGSSGSSSSDED